MRLSVRLGGAAAALLCATAVAAAPAAQAAQVRPAAVSASLSCFAEPINSNLGSISCTLNASGAAPYAVSWSATSYYAIVASDPSELDLTCNRLGLAVTVTARVTDATGAQTTATRTTSCLTGNPR
ncbi:hypothetical protein CFP65_2703 [Kitasatospora sp. MMS16-BH015]|uniref:hypothetical protein n=1 Tax=Kitasatospora sp. MMS16-BH015 TaxID=2018025 RepID=UPI000CA2D24A|nr:hypothetical protein [Kitasatospora sp. MMS16-BH015]AUG77524.1 hypothetical protein CFP65_2703 [Kitasatospora sp. MMS16-BH015]